MKAADINATCRQCSFCCRTPPFRKIILRSFIQALGQKTQHRLKRRRRISHHDSPESRFDIVVTMTPSVLSQELLSTWSGSQNEGSSPGTARGSDLGSGPCFPLDAKLGAYRDPVRLKVLIERDLLPSSFVMFILRSVCLPPSSPSSGPYLSVKLSPCN